jgi:hypothetical protein
MARQVVIPYAPRDQFRTFHARTQRWAIIVAHRRCGKTVATINDMIKRALLGPHNGRYAYIAPHYVQAKDIALAYFKEFTGPLTAHGVSYNDSELRINLPNNTIIRLYGADNYDRMRGLGFDGVVLDEYADFPPSAWPEVIRPALADKQGWAVWIGTPKGHNAFFDTWMAAQDDPEWFTLRLRASETGVIRPEELDAARKTMTEDQYRQEFECDFEAAIRGAYYGREMRQAEEDGRISGVPYDKKAEVHTAWDLGIADTTAIWFAQSVGREVRLIDYYENSGWGLDHYVGIIKSKGYNYGTHWLPHDAEVRELGSGQTRVETLASMGLKARIAPKLKVEDGINAARLLLPRCWFDARKCAYGIEALKQYRQEMDEKRKAFTGRPLHDFASHGADAFRYLAVSLKEGSPRAKPIHYPSVGVV